MMKHLFFFLFCFTFLTSVKQTFSQTKIPVDIFANHAYSANWVPFMEDDKVAVLYKYSDCSDPLNGIYPEKVLFKVTNKTNSKVYVLWDYYIEYTDGNIIAPKEGSNENTVQLTLLTNESAEGSCSATVGNKLHAFVRMKDDANNVVLKDLHFENFKTFILD